MKCASTTPLLVSAKPYTTRTQAELRQLVFDLMVEDGWSKSTKLLTKEANPKTAKNAKVGDYTAIMHLAPHALSGKNVCPWASKGCIAACLHTAGNRQYLPAKTQARIARTRLFFQHRPLFMEILRREIQAHVVRSHKLGLNPSVRLNGTSDIPWETTDIFNVEGVRFYDYTKSWQRAVDAIDTTYHLTFSRSECNDDHCRLVLSYGGTVAVVVEGYGISAHPKPLPERSSYFGESVPVIDGDEHDARYLDRPGSIIALRAKGDAIGDTSGFVVPRSSFE